METVEYIVETINLRKRDEKYLYDDNIVSILINSSLELKYIYQSNRLL